MSTIEFMLGATLLELGQLDAAQRHLESAAEGCRARGDAFYEFKARYYLARLAVRCGRRDEGAQGLLAAARVAHASGYRYDLLYVAVFVGELLHDCGHGREAERIVASASGAPLADAFVRAVVDSWRRLRPEIGGSGDSGANGGPPGPGVAFGQVSEWLLACDGIDDLSASLRAAPG